MPQQIKCSEPNSHRDSRALDQRSNSVDTNLANKLCVSNGKEGWKLETSNKFEGSQSICEDRAFQNGGSLLAPRPPSTPGLDDKDGRERCIPSSRPLARGLRDLDEPPPG